MATTAVDFVFNKLLGVNNNTNTINTLPYLIALERQSALQLSARQPGGSAYHGNSAVVAPNTTNSFVLLDGMETMAASLGYAKNGAFFVVVNAAAVTVTLTNTATNTNGTAGDTVFANIAQYTIYNLSGLDGNNAVNATINTTGTNGALLGITANGTIVIAGSSRFVGEDTATNGWPIAAATAIVTVNAATPCTVAFQLCGA